MSRSANADDVNLITRSPETRRPGLRVFYCPGKAFHRSAEILRRNSHIENPEEIPNAGNPESDASPPIKEPGESSPPDIPPPPAFFGERETPARTKAGLGRRFFALVLDYFILEILIAAATYPFEEKLSRTYLNSLSTLPLGDMDKLADIMELLLYYCLISLALWGFYFTFFHWTTGQTIGKKILNIQVVRMDGSPLDFLDALGRWIGFMFGLCLFGLGLLWALFNKDGRALHDKLAGTMVIRRAH